MNSKRKKLEEAIEILIPRLEKCDLCPRQCRVNRRKGLLGVCGIGTLTPVSCFCAHFGEEPQISGSAGSGTVFFTGCHLQCIFCQNQSIARAKTRKGHTPLELADLFLQIQEKNCHNLNLVSPTHVLPGILEGLLLAIEKGFHLPIIYNTSGYERTTIIQQLDKIIDIYLPDAKTLDSHLSRQFFGTSNYGQKMKKSIAEMFSQVGNLQCDSQGIAQKGLLVRHLVMPGCKEDSQNILQFLHEISPNIVVNIMGQYQPAGEQTQLETLHINRTIQIDEFNQITQYAKALGLQYIQ
jgi:putative pyruvate formate lyase activating enzyme